MKTYQSLFLSQSFQLLFPLNLFSLQPLFFNQSRKAIFFLFTCKFFCLLCGFALFTWWFSCGRFRGHSNGFRNFDHLSRLQVRRSESQGHPDVTNNT